MCAYGCHAEWFLIIFSNISLASLLLSHRMSSRLLKEPSYWDSIQQSSCFIDFSRKSEPVQQNGQHQCRSTARKRSEKSHHRHGRGTGRRPGCSSDINGPIRRRDRNYMRWRQYDVRKRYEKALSRSFIKKTFLCICLFIFSQDFSPCNIFIFLFSPLQFVGISWRSLAWPIVWT